MIGKKLYSTGIILTYGYSGNDKYGWNAKVEFGDLGHCNTKSTRGEISNKYFCPTIEESIEQILEDMNFMNISFIDESEKTELKRTLYYVNDGETEEYPPPSNWKEILKKQCQKFDFEFIY